MKIGNIGRLDPDLKEKGIVGLSHGAKMEEEVWNEFYRNPEHLAYESERLIAKLSEQDIEKTAKVNVDDLPQGTEREILVKQRINQSFFRSAVLSSYNFRCCISGVSEPALLEACHIVDWAQDTTNRTNPKNGLCFNPFFHKAYDKMLLAVTPDLIVIVSDELFQKTSDDKFRKYLKDINRTKIIEPDKFHPDRDLLQLHYEQYKNR